MNDYARIMFETVESDIQQRTKGIADRVQQVVSPQSLSPEQRQSLEAAIRQELDVLAFCFLGLFDNVGCRLPDGVLGYRVRAVSRIVDGVAQEAEIRDGETDYVDMWQQFQLQK